MWLSWMFVFWDRCEPCGDALSSLIPMKVYTCELNSNHIIGVSYSDTVQVYVLVTVGPAGLHAVILF